MGDKQWITFVVSDDEHQRIQKAASRADLSRSAFVRDRLFSAMKDNNEWSIPGPQKGNR